MSLDELRTALCDPAAFPDATASVETRETHISLVFLTEKYAYKIKKPVDFGFVDYSTAAKRQQMCEREIRLNRRLSDGVYLSVDRIVRGAGKLRVGGQGRVVEHAVKMLRLHDQRALGALLSAGEPIPLVRLGRQIAQFHANNSLPDSDEQFANLDHIRADWAENFKQTTAWIGQLISVDDYQLIRRAIELFLQQHALWFAERVADDRIRDCHGDLRAEHVYWIDHQFQIIDCIEFNQRFRYIDVASEVAFLAMDLIRLGHPAAAKQFVRGYVEESGDLQLFRLLNFYLCYRAYVRAKVCGFRFAAESGSTRARFWHSAKLFFNLATSFAKGLAKPKVILMTGLIGSGKSTLARGLAAALGIQRYSSDRLRKERAGLEPTTPQKVDFGTGIYSAADNVNTYQCLQDLARQALLAGESVVLDAAYPRHADRRQIAELAHRLGADCQLVECRAADDVIHARLKKRSAQENVTSDGRWALFTEFKQRYEPLGELPTAVIIRVDTAQEISKTLRQALLQINGFETLS